MCVRETDTAYCPMDDTQFAGMARVHEIREREAPYSDHKGVEHFLESFSSRPFTASREGCLTAMRPARRAYYTFMFAVHGAFRIGWDQLECVQFETSDSVTHSVQVGALDSVTTADTTGPSQLRNRQISVTSEHIWDLFTSGS